MSAGGRRACVTLALVLVAACEGRGASRTTPSASGVAVTRVFIVLPAGQSPAALYATITNASPTADTLRTIATSASPSVMLHGTMPGMATLDALPVAAGATERLAPGGRHGMLMGLASLARGDSVVVTFRFARAGDRLVQAHVIAYADVDTAAPPLR